MKFEIEVFTDDEPNQDEVALIIADALGSKYGRENIALSWANDGR